jgi:hypothetical protein
MSERSLEHPSHPAPRVDGGRLGVYAAIGATAGAVPLPWVPAVLVRRVRGALVHDVAVRHGLSLSSEARAVLADPSGPDAPSGKVVRALRYAGARLAFRALTRLGPLRALWPLGQALQVYALGALFDRYAAELRHADSQRLEHAEALRVRRAIDGAMARVLDAAPPGAGESGEATDPDDPRDRATALVDGLLGAAAGLPGHVMHRLETAFDALLAAEP